MTIENDYESHQYIIRYKNLERQVSFFHSDEIENIVEELKQEYRDIQIKKILDDDEI